MRTQTEPRFSAAERRAGAAYLRELFGGIAVYITLRVPSIMYGPAMGAGPLKTASWRTPAIRD